MTSQPARAPSGPVSVRLWQLSIGGPPDPSGLAWLTPAERARAARFVFERDRRRFQCCRIALRRILGTCLECSPGAVPLRYTQFGRPYVPRSAHPAPLDFNVSHSEDWALIAVTGARRVGVDVERRRPLSDLHGLAATVFSEGELADLAELPPERQVEAFFDCWTRKEAFIKAIGEGLSYPLQDFDVSLVPGQPAELRAIRGVGGRPDQWSLVDLVVPEGFSAALAVEAPAIRLETRQLPGG